MEKHEYFDDFEEDEDENICPICSAWAYLPCTSEDEAVNCEYFKQM